MPEAVIEIKRYPNRRFYDLSASRYISQEDIEKLVLEGKKVEIRDSQTGEELTRSVLTRILLDRQPDKMLLFPTDMLHFILRANDVSVGFLRDYFRHSLTYLDYLSRHNPAASSLTRPMHWVKAWLNSMALQDADGDQPPPDADGIGGDAVRLAQRIEQLEDRLKQLEAQGE
jgi:polyhydroxyalkanoate synthesis repressor PhaR